MYRKVFPRCEVEGSLEPVDFSHGGLDQRIPRKCDECDNLFEGECVRAIDQVEDYLSLDYGPCRKPGLCNPVLVEDRFIKCKVYVPEKCSDCDFLRYHQISGFRCHEDDQIWGRYGKTLDWGHWSPDLPNIGLESRKEVSMELMQAVKDELEVAAIREARDAYQELKKKCNATVMTRQKYDAGGIDFVSGGAGSRCYRTQVWSPGDNARFRLCLFFPSTRAL